MRASSAASAKGQQPPLRVAEALIGGVMTGGIFANAFERDEEDELFLRGYIPGRGVILPVLGLDELIVRHNLDADEYIHPGSHPHDRRISRSFVAATSP